MKKRTDILLLLPSLVGFAVFFIVPFIYIFYYAFTENAFSGKFVFFDNFVTLFKNEYFRLAMKNTFTFSIIAVPLTMLISLIIAALLVKYTSNLPFVKSAFFIPVILPSAAIIVLWNAYFSDFTPTASLLIIFLWKYSGLNIMLIITALAGMNKDMLDAAKIDGAGWFKTLINVTLPNIAPTLFFTFILSVVNSFKIFRESYLLYGNYPAEEVYMLQNYLNNHFEKMNYQNIATAAIFFFIVVYVIVAVLMHFEKKWSETIW